MSMNRRGRSWQWGSGVEVEAHWSPPSDAERSARSIAHVYCDHGGSPRSRGVVGVGDVGGERGDRREACKASDWRRLTQGCLALYDPDVEWDMVLGYPYGEMLETRSRGHAGLLSACCVFA